jgi:hypothetical protein
LKRGGQRPFGNTLALKHGARSAGLVRDVEAEVLELMAALGGAAPVRDGDGGVPAADITAIEHAARCLKRYRHVSAWCDMHGRIEEGGAVKPAAGYELQAGRALADALDALGMNPTTRARLGLDLVRSVSLAEAMSDFEDDDDAA